MNTIAADTQINNANLNEILTYIIPSFDINQIDFTRLIEIWKKCTLNIRYSYNYGRENMCEDILNEYKKNPLYVIYIIFEMLDNNEKQTIQMADFKTFVEKSIKHKLESYILEIEEGLSITDALRHSTVCSTTFIANEKIIQNIKFKKYLYQRLWLSLYYLYEKIKYENIVLEHLNIPLNTVEEQKYELIWSYLQNHQNVDEIPKDFWNWLSTDKLRMHLNKYSQENPLEITKQQFIDLLFCTQTIELKLNNSVSHMNNKIRILNDHIKPIFIEKIYDKCGIIDDHEQLYKIFSIEDSIKLIKKIEKKIGKPSYENYDNYSENEIYYKLYLCIYYKNINIYVCNKQKYIQKKYLENFLIDNSTKYLGHSCDNNSDDLLQTEKDQIESISDIKLSQDIKNIWFINTMKGFFDNTTSQIQLYWKYRSNIFFSDDFKQSVLNPIIFPNNWKSYINKFSTYNGISMATFHIKNTHFCVLKIKHIYKSIYSFPATYSDLLNKMNDIGDMFIENSIKDKRLKRSLFIISFLIYNSIPITNIMYRFSNSIVNDDEIIEFN